uniref:CAP domain-containing protein n=1 Tax=Roseivirga sp. TaxID=1964215 RepID=UPI0040482535
MKFFQILVLLLIPASLLAQKKWDDKYYTQLNNKNYRDFKLFKREINTDKVDYKTLNAAIFFVSNDARIKNGQRPVAYQANLEIMAYNHSIQMGEKNFFDHINPKTKNREGAEERAALAGISNPSISENISAVGGIKFDSYLNLADHIVQGWVDSPPHARTLFSANAVQLGCGVYYYKGVWQGKREIHKQGDGFWIATQNFQSFSEIVSQKAKDSMPSK